MIYIIGFGKCLTDFKKKSKINILLTAFPK